jgi:hypothetical protein
MLKIETPPGNQAKFLAELYVPADQVAAIKAAAERGRRLLQERLEAVRERESDDTRQLELLHKRFAEYSEKAAAEKRAESKATAELRKSLKKGNNDPAIAQAKVDAAVAQLRTYVAWQAAVQADSKELAAKLEKERAAELVASREEYAKQCDQQVAEFQTRLIAFLAESGPLLAQAEAGRQAAATERRRDWQAARAVA